MPGNMKLLIKKVPPGPDTPPAVIPNAPGSGTVAAALKPPVSACLGTVLRTKSQDSERPGRFDRLRSFVPVLAAIGMTPQNARRPRSDSP